MQVAAPRPAGRQGRRRGASIRLALRLAPHRGCTAALASPPRGRRATQLHRDVPHGAIRRSSEPARSSMGRPRPMLLRSDGTGAMRAPCELSCAPAFESKRLAPDMCLLKYPHDLPTGELATRRIKKPTHALFRRAASGDPGSTATRCSGNCAAGGAPHGLPGPGMGASSQVVTASSGAGLATRLRRIAMQRTKPCSGPCGRSCPTALVGFSRATNQEGASRWLVSARTTLAPAFP